MRHYTPGYSSIFLIVVDGILWDLPFTLDKQPLTVQKSKYFIISTLDKIFMKKYFNTKINISDFKVQNGCHQTLLTIVRYR